MLLVQASGDGSMPTPRHASQGYRQSGHAHRSMRSLPTSGKRNDDRAVDGGAASDVGAAAWANGMFFFRFWRDTGDRLFACFGGAFWLLAVSWIALALFNPAAEARPYIYALRLVAFLLIIVAMNNKNRPPPG